MRSLPTANGALGTSVDDPRADGAADPYLRRWPQAPDPVTDLTGLLVVQSRLAAVASGEALLVQTRGLCDTVTTAGYATDLLRSLGQVDLLLRYGMGARTVHLDVMCGSSITGTLRLLRDVAAVERMDPIDLIEDLFIEPPVAAGTAANAGTAGVGTAGSAVAGAAASAATAAGGAGLLTSLMRAARFTYACGVDIPTDTSRSILVCGSPSGTEAGTGRPYDPCLHVVRAGRADRVTAATAVHLGRLANPVMVDVTPDVLPEATVQACDLLDPARCPGRLILRVRAPLESVPAVLRGTGDPVRGSGHAVIWLLEPQGSDPVGDPASLARSLATLLRYGPDRPRARGVALGGALSSPDPYRRHRQLVGAAQRLAGALLAVRGRTG